MLTKPQKKILSVIVGATVISLLVYFTFDDWVAVLPNLKKISPVSLIWISILFIISQVVNSKMLQYYLTAFKVDIKLVEAFHLISIQSIGNYLPMSAGLVSSSVYLKFKKKLSIPNFVSYVAGDTILKLFCYGLVGVFIVIGRFFILDELKLSILAIVAAFTVASSLFLFINFSFKSRFKIINSILSINEGWQQIKVHSNLLLFSVLGHLLMLLLIALQFMIAFENIGISFDFSVIVLLTILTNIIKIASILPGNLGIRESITGFVTTTYGVSFGIGVMGSLITRSVSLVWIFLFGVIGMFFMGKKVDKQSPHKDGKS